MTFFRQIALLLPSAFLLGVLLFLLTHGQSDAGFGMLPLFEQWAGPAAAGWTPEIRLLAQAGLFFVPAYGLTLLFVLAITLAERAVFGRPPDQPRSAIRRSFGGLFAVLFLVASGALVLWGERLAARRAPEAVLAPLVVGFAPFAAGAAAFFPAAVLAAPIAALRKAAGA